MASRDIHNRIAKTFLPWISYSKINETNRVIDEPVKWMGPSHRVTRHDHNPLKFDSLIVSGGDPQKEMVRQLHILVDISEAGKTLEKVMETYDNLRYFSGSKRNRKHRK